MVRMSALPREIPGVDRVNFILKLEERKTNVAQHVLAAWDGVSTDEINTHLEKASATLHRIAETAGAMGYAALGATALRSEQQIISHLEGPYADLAVCPGEIVWCVDTFVEACAAILNND